MEDLAGHSSLAEGTGCMSCCYSEKTRCCDQRRANRLPPSMNRPAVAGGGLLWSSVLGQKSLLETSEDLRGGRLSKPGSCSLGLANLRFFQRLVFSKTENVFG